MKSLTFPKLFLSAAALVALSTTSSCVPSLVRGALADPSPPVTWCTDDLPPDVSATASLSDQSRSGYEGTGCVVEVDSTMGTYQNPIVIEMAVDGEDLTAGAGDLIFSLSDSRVSTALSFTLGDATDAYEAIVATGTLAPMRITFLNNNFTGSGSIAFAGFLFPASTITLSGNSFDTTSYLDTTMCASVFTPSAFVMGTGSALVVTDNTFTNSEQCEGAPSDAATAAIALLLGEGAIAAVTSNITIAGNTIVMLCDPDAEDVCAPAGVQVSFATGLVAGRNIDVRDNNITVAGSAADASGSGAIVFAKFEFGLDAADDGEGGLAPIDATAQAVLTISGNNITRFITDDLVDGFAVVIAPYITQFGQSPSTTSQVKGGGKIRIAGNIIAGFKQGVSLYASIVDSTSAIPAHPNGTFTLEFEANAFVSTLMTNVLVINGLVGGNNAGDMEPLHGASITINGTDLRGVSPSSTGRSTMFHMNNMPAWNVNKVHIVNTVLPYAVNAFFQLFDLTTASGLGTSTSMDKSNVAFCGTTAFDGLHLNTPQLLLERALIHSEEGHFASVHCYSCGCDAPKVPGGAWCATPKSCCGIHSKPRHAAFYCPSEKSNAEYPQTQA